MGQLVDWAALRSVGLAGGWSVGGLVGRGVCPSVCLSVGGLVDQQVSLSLGQLVKQSVSYSDGLLGCLVHQLVGQCALLKD